MENNTARCRSGTAPLADTENGAEQHGLDIPDGGYHKIPVQVYQSFLDAAAIHSGGSLFIT